MDPSQYVVETFASQVGGRFTTTLATGESVALELTEVQPGPVSPKALQFSILFRGPRDRYLQQRIYHLENPVLGGIDLFLVPVGEAPEGLLYQAVFNRLLRPELQRQQ
jgi:hypothetical protein